MNKLDTVTCEPSLYHQDVYYNKLKNYEAKHSKFNSYVDICRATHTFYVIKDQNCFQKSILVEVVANVRPRLGVLDCVRGLGVE